MLEPRPTSALHPRSDAHTSAPKPSPRAEGRSSDISCRLGVDVRPAGGPKRLRRENGRGILTNVLASQSRIVHMKAPDDSPAHLHRDHAGKRRPVEIHEINHNVQG